MRFIKKLGLLVAVAAAALSLTASAAMATSDVIEPDTGTQGTEHVTVGNIGPSLLQVGTNAFVSCNQIVGEGTIDDFTAEEGTTEVGALESLDFLQNGAQKCPATGLPVSSCNTTVSGFPLDVQVNEVTNELLVTNVEVVLACESFIGTIAVFGAGGATDDVLAGEASNSFVCPASGQFRASMTLSTEANAPGGVQEVMLTEL
jgi:hypothetical protein